MRSSKTLKVLFADDDEMYRLLLRAALSEEAVAVVTAPDVIVLDVEMPGIDPSVFGT